MHLVSLQKHCAIILCGLTSKTYKIHIVFDIYKLESIKANEWKWRALGFGSPIPISITSSLDKLPVNKFWDSSDNKTTFQQFLLNGDVLM